MLEAVNLGLKLDKAEYKPRLRALQRHLHELQRACREAQVGTVVVFEGWDAAGKGSSIRKLTERLEPRAFRLHATRAPRTHELPTSTTLRAGSRSRPPEFLRLRARVVRSIRLLPQTTGLVARRRKLENRTFESLIIWPPPYPGVTP